MKARKRLANCSGANDELSRRGAAALLAVLILILGFYRFSLIDRGHFFWGDEIRYLRAEEALTDIGHGDFHAAAGRLFQSLGRPGFVLISMIPAQLERWWGSADPSSSPLNRHNIASAFNVIVSLTITWLVYAVARAWSLGRGFSLLAALIFSLLAQSHVWIRHLVPYNESLVVFLTSLLLLCWNESNGVHSRRRVFVAGFLSAIGFATYPGHYMFAAINFVTAVAAARKPICAGVCFASGAILLIAIFEALARYAGTTWIGSGRQFSPTMGLFSEGIVFVWHYLRDAEGAIGVVLAGCLIVGLVQETVKAVRPKEASKRWHEGTEARRHEGGSHGVTEPRSHEGRLRPDVLPVVVMGAAVLCYLAHATLGVFFHITVFYGRVLLMYMPFVVIAAVAGLASIRSRAWRRLAVFLLMGSSAWSFVRFARDYASLDYPADLWYRSVAAKNMACCVPPDELYGSRDGSPFGLIPSLNHNFVMVADSRPEGADSYVSLATHDDAQASGAEIIGVNVRWMFYIQDEEHHFKTPVNYQLVANTLNPLTLPALQFEGHRPCERQRLRDRRYTTRVYVRNETSTTKRGDSVAQNSN